jgi:type III pantothenate kinase
VALPQPDKVGIDRLLNAVAIKSRRATNASAIVVDAGSAVTVDVVDKEGVFHGGAIFPGLQLMVRALHEHTALLPMVEVDGEFTLPGKSTVAAMKAGVFCAVSGGIREIVERLLKEPQTGQPCEIFAGGGDAPLLVPHLPFKMTLWPEMTLEGLRITSSEAA